MASKTIYCHLCQAAFEEESTIKRHISSFHLEYRPYECSICKENGDIYKTASENAMQAHIAANHSATNAGDQVCKLPLKEYELKAATVECLRLSALQLSERSATGNKMGKDISIQERNDENRIVIGKKALLRNPTKSISYARILHFKPQDALDKKPKLAPNMELAQKPIAAKQQIPDPKQKPAQKMELVQKPIAAKKPIPAPKPIAVPKLTSVQKLKLTKILIVICIDRGYAKFVTSEGKKFPLGLLSNYLPILCQSKALKECETHIAFEPWRAKQSDPRTAIAAREKFENFSQEIQLIAHLWAKRNIVAEFREYPEHAKKVLALADFCDGLFGRDQSILACKRLKISLVDSWPFSVVTNCAPTKKLILKEMPFEKQKLHFTLLDAIYEKKIPQNVHVELYLYRNKSTTEFNDELKKRFRLSTGLDFELIVLSPRIIPSMMKRNKYGTIEIESGIPQSGEARYIAIITQRSFSTDLGQQSI